MANNLILLKSMIIVQLFYAIAITIIAQVMPPDNSQYVTSFQELADEINEQNVASTMQSGLDSTLDIPALDVGALVFYSGNIIIDLLLNFISAIPQMFYLLMTAILYLFQINAFLTAQFILFASTIITVLYVIGAISLLSTIRSGRVIA